MAEAPLLSVIVSINDGATTLRQVLAAIRASDLPTSSYELIVVDDASADGSVAIAARYADTVVRLSGRVAGPAYARNRGVEVARGEIIAFVNGDVVVRPDTLSRMTSTLLTRPEIDAVSASNDDSAGASNFISEYWNLLFLFGQRRYSGRCAQFAPGCGAVRRDAFIAAGMYDEWRYETACLESVELGARLLATGRAAVLSTELQVTHLKRWDFRSVCGEVWHRGKLFTRSLGYSRTRALAPSDIVFTLSRALTPALALMGTLLLAGAFVVPSHAAREAALALAVLLATNFPIYRFYTSKRGLRFAIASAPIHIAAQIVTAAALCTGWIQRYLIGDVSPDATTQAYFEVGLEVWPPIPRKLNTTLG